MFHRNGDEAGGAGQVGARKEETEQDGTSVEPKAVHVVGLGNEAGECGQKGKRGAMARSWGSQPRRRDLDSLLEVRGWH